MCVCVVRPNILSIDAYLIRVCTHEHTLYSPYTPIYSVRRPLQRHAWSIAVFPYLECVSRIATQAGNGRRQLARDRRIAHARRAAGTVVCGALLAQDAVLGVVTAAQVGRLGPVKGDVVRGHGANGQRKWGAWRRRTGGVWRFTDSPGIATHTGASVPASSRVWDRVWRTLATWVVSAGTFVRVWRACWIENNAYSGATFFLSVSSGGQQRPSVIERCRLCDVTVPCFSTLQTPNWAKPTEQTTFFITEPGVYSSGHLSVRQKSFTRGSQNALCSRI